MSKKERFITGLLMSLCMALALSGFFIVSRNGFFPGWHVVWFKAFITAWPVAYVFSIVIGKPVSKLAGYLAAHT